MECDEISRMFFPNGGKTPHGLEQLVIRLNIAISNGFQSNIAVLDNKMKPFKCH